MYELHIIPNDEEHEMGTTCRCIPQVHYPSDDFIIIVHSPDRDGINDLVEELALELNYGDWGVYINEDLFA